MWLQLSVAFAQEAPAPARLDAAAAAFNAYSDADIVAWAPSARARVTVGDGVSIGASWNADFVSGATPVVSTDTVSTATPFTETRTGGTLDLTWPGPARSTLDAAVTGSTESDHQVVVGSAGVGKGFRDDMTRLRSGASVAWSRDGTRADPGAAGDSLDATIDLGWVQILGPTTTTTVRATGGYTSCDPRFGCGASAYRFVPQGAVFLPEHHPATRARGAASLALAQALGTQLALHLGYRYYRDSWLVEGHTGDLALAWSTLGGRGLLRAEGRGVVQSAAAFAVDDTHPIAEYRTADRELHGLIEGTAGLRARWNFFGLLRWDRVAIDLHAERLWFGYPEFPGSPTRDGWIVGGGVDVRR